jgi:FKBP-type peptidyl-prolyl cis-trans isomerase FklB
MVLMACQGNTQEKVQLKTQADSISYSIGLDIGKSLKHQSVDIVAAAVTQGLLDAGDTANALLTEEQAQQVMMLFQQQLAMNALEKNKKEGEAFLAQNKTKEGVKTTESGLQYKIITTGTGPKPTMDQTVTFHYRGTTIGGGEFGNSYKQGQPITYRVNGLIKGWMEALQLMPVGSKWELYVPYDLAYGETGMGNSIQPGSTLIFELELLATK